MPILKVQTTKAMLVFTGEQLSAAVLVLAFLSNVATGTGVEIEVTLDLGASSAPECSSLDLTNTSILVYYRLYSSEPMEPIEEWSCPAEVNISESSSSQFILLLPNNSFTEGLQIGLLQLEHGGEGCYCWEVLHLEIILHVNLSVLANVSNINEVECLSHGQRNDDLIGENFCYGSASEAREVVTQVFFFSGEDVKECPGNSSLLGGQALLEKCTRYIIMWPWDENNGRPCIGHGLCHIIIRTDELF